VSRQTDRQTPIQTDRKTDRQTYRQTEKERESRGGEWAETRRAGRERAKGGRR
jgi:hypothetical protein